MRPDVDAVSLALLPPGLLREGSYSTVKNGQTITVNFMDGDVVRDAADLLAIIQGEYKGTDSTASIALQQLMDKIQNGMLPSDMDWTLLNRLRAKYASQLAAFRASKDAETEGWVELPEEGQGRVTDGDGAPVTAPVTEALRDARLLEQYATPSTTKLDRAGSAAHLLDSVLHDLAHVHRHVSRIMAPDVKADADSIQFNAEHALNHTESAQDHASRLDKHLSTDPSNPKIHAQERDTINDMRSRTTEAVSAAGFPQLLRAGDTPREDSGRFLAAGSRIYDPKLLNADSLHAAEAANLLVQAGRIRIGGQGDESKTAAANITGRVGDRANVTTMAVKGNPYTQLKAVVETLVAMAEGRPYPPPDLKVGTDPNKLCGGCAMYWMGECGGYWNEPVQPHWTCTSWVKDKDDFQRPLPMSLAAAKPGRAASDVLSVDPEHPDLTKPTVGIDFDGVIHAGGHGMPGEVEGQPVDGAQDALKQLSDRYRIVIFTARQDFGAVRDWLKANGMNDYVDEITNRKPNALAYVDDRGIHFVDWKSSLDALNPDTPTKQPIVKEADILAAVPLLKGIAG